MARQRDACGRVRLYIQFACAHQFRFEQKRAKHSRTQLVIPTAEEFKFETAHIQADSRREYGETRHVALGSLHGRLHVLCFAETPDGIRVISFRKANDRETKRYAKYQTPD
ncbi:MAG: BrnT family toxin [Caldimonas sp.]